MIEALLMSLIYGLQIHLIKENLLNIEINKNIEKSLTLQLINRKEASSLINLFLSLHETSLDI